MLHGCSVLNRILFFLSQKSGQKNYLSFLHFFASTSWIWSFFVEFPTYFQCGHISFYESTVTHSIQRCSVISFYWDISLGGMWLFAGLFVTTWLCVTALNFKWPEEEGKSVFGPLLVSGDLQFHWCLGSSRCAQISFPYFFFFLEGRGWWWWQHLNPHISQLFQFKQMWESFLFFPTPMPTLKCAAILLNFIFQW